MTAGPVWRPAILGVARGDGRVLCELCPHGCDLRPGQTGSCRVRRNRAGVLETATFAAAVTHLDAIERKPLYHVRPGSMVLTSAAPGCTFTCDYCINYRLSQYGRPAVLAVDGESADDSWLGDPADPAALVAQALRENALLGFSYTEPGLAPELTLALAELAEPAGVPLVWKTNGFLTPQAVELVGPVLEAVNVDVKAAAEGPHRRLTGASLAPVLDTIERFRAAGVWVEVSTPLIPGVSDQPDQLATIARTLAAIDPQMPWHLLRFVPDFRMRQPPPTLPSALDAARQVGRDAGLEFVYVERALGQDGRDTRCPACSTVVVARGIWETVEYRIRGGTCPNCAWPIPGRWGGLR